jgi:cytochrome c5
MKKTFAIILILLTTISVFGQEWLVPADKKGKLSPFGFTDETRRTGENLYNMNCKSCHGTPEMGNFQASLNPPPADPASIKIQQNLDGDLFFKITQGRGSMPSFKNSLSSNDVWNLISFIRKFNKTYVQAVMPLIRSVAYPGAEIIVSLIKGPATGEITMKVTAVTEKSKVPVTNAGVKLFVRRTFGKMMIDEEKTTGSNGEAIFKIPEGLPGDTAGNIHVTAMFSDEDAFGSAGRDTMLQAGTITIPVSLTRDRAMWNVVRKAPVWIIVAYSLGVLGVWAFIIIIMLKLRDISIIGEHINRIASGKKTQT